MGQSVVVERGENVAHDHGKSLEGLGWNELSLYSEQAHAALFCGRPTLCSLLHNQPMLWPATLQHVPSACRLCGILANRLCGLALWLVFVAMLGGLPTEAASSPQRLTITQALAVSANTPNFPDTEAAGAPKAQMVQLPDDWSQSQPDYSGSRWYRVRFDRPAHSDQQSNGLTALYVEQVCHNLEVWLNGQLLHLSGRIQEPITRNCYQPQLITLPVALLRDADNLLDLRVYGMSQGRVSARLRGGGLSVLQLGPLLEMSQAHASRAWWNSTAVQLVSVTLLVLGGYFLVLGLLNRREIYLFYFGLICIGWAVLSVSIWARYLPIHSQWVEWLAASVMPWVAAAGVQFLLSYAGRRSRAIEIFLLIQGMLVPLSLWISNIHLTFLISTAWYVLLFVEVLAAIAIYGLVARHESQPRWRITLLMLVTIGLFLLIELASQYRLLPPLLYTQWGLTLMLLAMAFRLLQGFEHNLAAVEAGRANLERRVREATAEIERNFSQLAELRVEQVTEKERKRIAADLHDDLGAKLLTIIHTSESDRISTLAREALEEMRLSVRGLTGKPVRMADALADWRAEIVLRLGQTNVEADWDHPNEDLDQLLPARAYVQTTRILREAVSNIIKHSGASLCKIRCTVANHEFGISIQDNGKGIAMELDGKLDRGHGLASMKHRAKQLQGQCLVESGPGCGTMIRITLPL